jgi:hypothetical protein
VNGDGEANQTVAYYCNGRRFDTLKLMREYRTGKNKQYAYAHYKGFKYTTTKTTVVVVERCK